MVLILQMYEKSRDLPRLFTKINHFLLSCVSLKSVIQLKQTIAIIAKLATIIVSISLIS
nr:MAG TPA: hypothetical protein [Microviridae sp.]